MAETVKLSKLEYRLMQVLWSQGASSVRAIQQALPEKRRPAYTTVQTTIFRMESKGIVERAGQAGAAYLFAPRITREKAQRALIEDLLAMFGGVSQPVMAYLVDSGKLSLADVKEAEQALQQRKKGGKA
ncbi:BlaI/MecI/CopY family transcriptional regulator [Acidipila sp. EB88]|uniref:BlaI/MecI/CopY family transcriptional regulator n=1 Tax=Acidipila sp. EB88 TaxID=2305226 RepID=UPI000F5FC813|nr:BlaI/MecI/CopY family transcriptional regulator [Acidipila sp. EB88]RRA47901.1 BlaI/MecI/CopY family transcriptional regulator [Acidipila sp. EB88]